MCRPNTTKAAATNLVPMTIVTIPDKPRLLRRNCVRTAPRHSQSETDFVRHCPEPSISFYKKERRSSDSSVLLAQMVMEQQRHFGKLSMDESSADSLISSESRSDRWSSSKSSVASSTGASTSPSMPKRRWDAWAPGIRLSHDMDVDIVDTSTQNVDIDVSFPLLALLQR